MRCEFETTYQEYENEHSKMKVAFVTATETDKEWDDKSRNSCRFYDDLMLFDSYPYSSPKKFAEIIQIETDCEYRCMGYASSLVQGFIKSNPNLPIFVRMGVSTPQEYDKLNPEDISRLQRDICEEVIPFYEENSFTEVYNHLLAERETVAIMCYPKSLSGIYAENFEDYIYTEDDEEESD